MAQTNCGTRNIGTDGRVDATSTGTKLAATSTLPKSRQKAKAQ
jgi:hypothetical protein